MPERKRLGLTDLAHIRKPLVQTEVPLEVPQTVPLHHHEVPQAVPLEVPPEEPRIIKQRKEKQTLVSQSFKLPVALNQKWTRLASFHGVTKTGILLEALDTFLDRLPQPPESQRR